MNKTGFLDSSGLKGLGTGSIEQALIIAEASKELHAEVRPPEPAAPGRAAREDYEYARCGTANLFVAVEPLAGVRRLTVTERRGGVGFAERMRRLRDEWYPEAAVIRVVLDDLNTHRPGQARRDRTTWPWTSVRRKSRPA